MLKFIVNCVYKTNQLYKENIYKAYHEIQICLVNEMNITCMI